MYSRLHVRSNNACFVGVHGMQVNGVFSTSYRILRFVSHKTFLYELYSEKAAYFLEDA